MSAATGRFRFHDSLAREVRTFEPQEPGVVRIYTCGPTVYSNVHLGNYRAYTCWDVLRRSLELAGLRVVQVVNVTDVGHLTDDDVADSAGEDKLELAGRRTGLCARDVAARYTAYFFDVARALNWRLAQDPDEPRFHPRATDHVANAADPHDVHTMVGHIEELVRRGHAYATPSGNVYFEVATFPGYGRLSGNSVADLVAGARVEVNPEKRHPADFALWKRDESHQMQWDSPWGRGFPGWHIECSVMARKYLGDTLDIHTGGEDHLFPHHECEIAQSEGVTGRPFSRFWLHNRFLLVDGAKMAKSAGTMYVLEDVERHFGAQTDEARRQVHRALRYFLLSAHYRAPINFSWEALGAAVRAVESLDAMVRGLVEDASRPDRPAVASKSHDAASRFLAALQDDLNVSDALATVHEFRSFANRNGPYSPGDARCIRERVAAFDRVLGLGLIERAAPGVPGADDDVERLVAERQAARKARDFARADAIRRDLAARGLVLEDTPQGVRWYR
jgi:cysteinyl-tRNA synthetase